MGGVAYPLLISMQRVDGPLGTAIFTYQHFSFLMMRFFWPTRSSRQNNFMSRAARSVGWPPGPAGDHINTMKSNYDIQQSSIRIEQFLGSWNGGGGAD